MIAAMTPMRTWKRKERPMAPRVAGGAHLRNQSGRKARQTERAETSGVVVVGMALGASPPRQPDCQDVPGLCGIDEWYRFGGGPEADPL
jgi:hypothetical protein